MGSIYNNLFKNSSYNGLALTHYAIAADWSLGMSRELTTLKGNVDLLLVLGKGGITLQRLDRRLPTYGPTLGSADDSSQKLMKVSVNESR